MLLISKMNEPIKWIGINFFCEMLFAIIDVFIFTNLFKIKSTKKRKISLILIYGVLRTLFLILIPTPFNRIINPTFAVLLFKFIFKTTTEKSILGEVINSITIIITEVIVAKILCLIIPDVDNYVMVLYNCRCVAILKISVSLVRLFICYIIKRKKLEINISDNLSKKNRNNIIIVSLLEYMVICFNEMEMTKYITNFPYSILVIDIISIIICFYISMKAILEISMLEKQDIKINELETYNKTLSIMYDSIRGFRHDFSNFVQAMDGYSKVNDLDGFKKMSADLTKEYRAVNSMEILDPAIINNPPAYSIITNKYYLAQKNNISINMEVLTDLSIANEYNYEFCRILGILLDNAIEATKNINEKIINIRIMKQCKTEKKLIIIENTYDTSFDIQMDKLFNKGYTSKEDTNNEHGLGLWTVKRILEKNEKLDLYTQKGEMFSQQLEIYK